jgi:hypothetical protein
MKYGIFSLESGSALAWYGSADAAFDAVRQIAESEPEAIDGLGLLESTTTARRGTPFRGKIC